MAAPTMLASQKPSARPLVRNERGSRRGCEWNDAEHDAAVRRRNLRHRQRHEHRKADDRAYAGQNEFKPRCARRNRTSQDEQQRKPGASGDGRARRRKKKRIEGDDREARGRKRAAEQQHAGNSERYSELFTGGRHASGGR